MNFIVFFLQGSVRVLGGNVDFLQVVGELKGGGNLLPTKDGPCLFV